MVAVAAVVMVAVMMEEDDEMEEHDDETGEEAREDLAEEKKYDVRRLGDGRLGVAETCCSQSSSLSNGVGNSSVVDVIVVQNGDCLPDSDNVVAVETGSSVRVDLWDHF